MFIRMYLNTTESLFIGPDFVDIVYRGYDDHPITTIPGSP
jgi:hypothetical protein